MIQRIQSLYLLLIFIGCICIFFFPLANYLEYQFTILGAKQLVSETTLILKLNTIPLIVIISVIGILSLITIFLYKNRPLQIKLSRIILLLNIIFIVIVFFYTDIIEKKIHNTSQYSISSFIPLITLILSFLTVRAIRKDEELIKSADRLR